jgi:hypothetical protein
MEPGARRCGFVCVDCERPIALAYVAAMSAGTDSRTLQWQKVIVRCAVGPVDDATFLQFSQHARMTKGAPSADKFSVMLHLLFGLNVRGGGGGGSSIGVSGSRRRISTSERSK